LADSTRQFYLYSEIVGLVADMASLNLSSTGQN